MNRIPLLQALDGGSKPGTPTSTPRTPAHSWKKAYTYLTFITTILVLTCLGFSTLRLYERDVANLFTTPKPPTLGWGPEAAIYQACKGNTANVSLPALTPVQHWRSARQLPEQSTTIVTQLSLERLPMLRGQCKVWKDRIAAVVYVPFVEGFGAASAELPALNGSSIGHITQLLTTFHSQVEGDQATCALDIELVVETFPSWEEPTLRLYPFNAIRNRGLMLAQTEGVILLDVDFLPAASLPDTYQGKPKAFNALMSQLVENKTGLVLPAFETAKDDATGRKVALTAAVNGKAHAVSLFRKKQILGFHVAQYKWGHGTTNFTRWLTTKRSYAVKYRNGFEPYVLVARRYVPWYDERFRGYGRDKITHLAYMCNGLGVALEVHPTAFVVHTPHPKAPTFAATKELGQWDKLEDMYAQVKVQIAAKEFVPVTSFAHWCARYVEPEQTAEVVSDTTTAPAAAKASSKKQKKKGSRRALN